MVWTICWNNLNSGIKTMNFPGVSPIIEWVDWVNQSENDENEEAIRVEVHFEDGTEETFEKGITLRQIWHEDVL